MSQSPQPNASQPVYPATTPGMAPQVVVGAVPPGVAPSGGAVHPHTPADDKEEVYYDGSPLLRGALGHFLFWSLLGIVLIVGSVYLKSRYHQHVPIWLVLACVVVGLFLFTVPMILVRRTRYRITNYRIDYERGWFSTTIDTMELWHVEDIKFHQSFWDKIIGAGTIEVLSHDDTTPKLVMTDIPHARQLFHTLQQRIIAVKRQPGVLKTDSGT